MIYRIITLSFIFLLTACYSFTGSSLDPRIKTIKIDRFPNYSELQNPNMSLDFTNELQHRFSRRTSLSLTNSDDSDVRVEGEIINYTITPSTIVSGDQAALNRLTITVRVRYFNEIQEEKSFNKTFSAYEDYDRSKNIQQVESSLIPEINTRLIDQIFNAIVADW